MEFDAFKTVSDQVCIGLCIKRADNGFFKNQLFCFIHCFPACIIVGYISTGGAVLDQLVIFRVAPETVVVGGIRYPHAEIGHRVGIVGTPACKSHTVVIILHLLKTFGFGHGLQVDRDTRKGGFNLLLDRLGNLCDLVAFVVAIDHRELEGIGATLGSEDGYTIVKHLVPGGAAEKEGSLKVEDKIIGVGQGADGAFEDVVDMKLDDVVKRVRGKANTVVRLEVLPADGGKTKDIKITRAKIELKDSAAKGKVFEAGTKPDGTPYKIGVIDLPSFYADMSGMRNGNAEYRSTTRDMKRILEDFNAQGCDACIVDLRANGGGSLPESINTTGLFIKTGPVVQVKGPKRGSSVSFNSFNKTSAEDNFKIDCYSDHNSDVTWDKPLVVLISKFSASASEIFAGAIQDYKRGLIVGDHSTHGKGTVQSLLPLGEAMFSLGPAMGALKVTIQQFYRPDGDSTQNRGVLADVELPSITTHMDVGESDLDYALAFDQVPAQQYQKFNLVSPAIVKYLKQASEARCAQSEDFQKTVKKIECYLKNKDKSNITLNEKKFFEERAELIPEEEEKKQLEDTVKQDGSDIEETPYLREALDITADYVKALQVGVANMPNPAAIKAKPTPNNSNYPAPQPAAAL